MVTILQHTQTHTQAHKINVSKINVLLKLELLPNVKENVSTSNMVESLQIIGCTPDTTHEIG